MFKLWNYILVAYAKFYVIKTEIHCILLRLFKQVWCLGNPNLSKFIGAISSFLISSQCQMDSAFCTRLKKVTYFSDSFWRFEWYHLSQHLHNIPPQTFWLPFAQLSFFIFTSWIFSSPNSTTNKIYFTGGDWYII